MSATSTASASAKTIHRAAVLSAAIAALGLIAGCGSSSSSGSSSTSTPAKPATTPATTSTSTSTSESEVAKTTPNGQLLTIEANREGELKYNKTSLTANAGQVSIAMTNMAPLGHNVTIESSSGKILGAVPTFQGGTRTLKLNLKPGTYKFFCSVPGHRMAGMEGTLNIR
ncbi:MAG: plastocyanin/azurin family copper-binding protein [Solirubrobacteraceae bacterium]